MGDKEGSGRAAKRREREAKSTSRLVSMRVLQAWRLLWRSILTPATLPVPPTGPPSMSSDPSEPVITEDEWRSTALPSLLLPRPSHQSDSPAPPKMDRADSRVGWV